ncbi:MAG: response regulator transcription factor [Prevotella sp.]|nr:response regulator transcription factor [Prevotella sp.]
MTLTCSIIDDEPLATQLLESYVKKTPYLKLVGVYNSAVTAMRDLREQPVQLLLLDIQMPELSGIEFTQLLPKETKVIFTTAFPQYAVEGFRVSALDYLLKPISYQDFLRATDKALEWFAIAEKRSTYEQDRFLFVKSDYKLVRVSLDDILYIEGLKDYVRIFLESGERLMSLMSMKKLEEFLPRPEFLRTHRSYIVHMTKIGSVDHMRIVFGDQYIPISDNFKESITQYLEQHTLA